MAEKNLTDALLNRKDKEPRKPKARPPRPERSPGAQQTLPYRPRSFDTFYTFVFTLLIATLLAQLVAIVIYS